VIEADRQQAVLSIFGGKLTDCLNIGDEICVEVQAMGIRLPRPRQRWYGEAESSVKQAFLQQARDIDLDGYTPASAAEPLSARLWRRYGAAAMQLVEAIRAEPKQSEIVIGTFYVAAIVKPFSLLFCLFLHFFYPGLSLQHICLYDPPAYRTALGADRL
jgi:glycerol-3-phosphate dehydrogenase